MSTEKEERHIIPVKQENYVLAAGDRLTLAFTMTHETMKDDPTQIADVCQSRLKLTQQPWERRSQVGMEWKRLNFGWLEEEEDGISCFVLQNYTGKEKSPTQLSEEEIAALAKQDILLDLGSGNGDLFIPPGWTFSCFPVNASQIRIRSRHGSAPYRLTAFSK